MNKSPCICCDAPLCHQAGTPQVCGDCWDDLSRFERARLWGDVRSQELLESLRTDSEQQQDHVIQLAGLRKSLDRLHVLLKPITEQVDDLAGAAFKMIRAYDQIARNELDGDQWRDGWRDSQ